jgi:hypothetical protein
MLLLISEGWYVAVWTIRDRVAVIVGMKTV